LRGDYLRSINNVQVTVTSQPFVVQFEEETCKLIESGFGFVCDYTLTTKYSGTTNKMVKIFII